MDTFADLLRQYRERADRSRNNLAHEVGVDPSYLTRIEHGDREPPRRPIVDAIARGLRLSKVEWDALRVAAGYAPTWAAEADPIVMRAVAEVLIDPRISQEEREHFGLVVLQIARRWQLAGRKDGRR